MRIRQLLVMALAAGIAVACDARDDEIEDTDALPGAEPAPMTPEPTMEDMVISRSDFNETDQAGDLDISGTAELRHTTMDAGAPLELMVRLEGLTANHAWHIHQGACSNAEAPVAVPFTDALTAGADGVAERTTTITSDKLTQQHLETGEYSVRVHAGGTDQPGQAIACADIKH
jgi:hypothetical protein